MTFGLSGAALAGLTIGGATIASGYMSSKAQQGAANTAAGAQMESTRLGIEEQRRQMEQIQKLLSPFVSASTGKGTYTPISANDLINTSAGDWRPNETLYANDQSYRTAWDKFINGHQQQFGVAPNLERGSDLAVAQNQLRGNGFDLNAYNQAQATKPQTMGSLTAQQNMLGLNGADAQQLAIAGIDNSPMMSALTQQGENAILQNASATGGLRGGNVQGALAQFRPQLLAQLIDQQYSRLGGLTSAGQNAAAMTGNAGMSAGNQISGLMQQSGAAQAGAALAGGRAQAGMWNNVGGAAGMFAGLGGFNSAPAAYTPPTQGYAGSYAENPFMASGF